MTIKTIKTLGYNEDIKKIDIRKEENHEYIANKQRIKKIPNTLFSFFIHFLKKQKLSFFFVVLFSMASALSISVWPVIIENLIDTLNSLENNQNIDVNSHLLSPFIYTILFWILVEFLGRGRGVSFAFFLPKFEANIRFGIFSYLTKNSHAYFTKNFSGGIGNRAAELPRSANMVIDILLTIFLPIVIALVISTSLFLQMDGVLSIILFTWIASHLTLSLILSKYASRLSKIQTEARNFVFSSFLDSIINHMSFKLFSRHQYEQKRFLNLQEDEVRKHRSTLLFIESIALLLNIVGVCSMCAILFISIKLWQQGSISIGSVVFVLTTVINLLERLWEANDEMTYLFKEIGICQQSLTLMQDEAAQEDYEGAQELLVEKGEVEFKNVTFTYQKNNNLFKNKSVKIEGGEKIGLVGLSGSGKTTFASLILRLYDIDEGVIIIDGQDISKVSLDSLRNNITFIPQQPILFHRSIRENISYGKPNATEKEITEACKAAYCHDFISALPNGYDTMVGEFGGNLSGGQKQLIIIARAILKNSSIIIMDEATSALDNFTERNVQKAFNNLTNNKTTLIIAHRLSTLLDVDRIFVFKHGDIVEKGTHDELIAKEHHYHMLWSLEKDGYIPESIVKDSMTNEV